jgi:hypothetical protein
MNNTQGYEEGWTKKKGRWMNARHANPLSFSRVNSQRSGSLEPRDEYEIEVITMEMKMDGGRRGSG